MSEGRPHPSPESAVPRPVSRRRKWLTRGLAACAALVLITLVVFYLSIDSIIRTRVEAAAADGLGQPATLSAARLAVLSGRLTLSDLKARNPAGFSTPQFLSLDRCTITIQARSLLGNTVRVEDLTIDGLNLIVEQNQLKNNLQDVLQHLREHNKNSAGGKDLDIGKVRLTNTALTIALQNIPGVRNETRTYKLAAIEMDHPTNPDGRLMKFSELTARVLAQIAAQASDDSQIDPNVRAVLKTISAALDNDLPNTIKSLFHGMGVR